MQWFSNVVGPQPKIIYHTDLVIQTVPVSTPHCTKTPQAYGIINKNCRIKFRQNNSTSFTLFFINTMLNTKIWKPGYIRGSMTHQKVPVTCYKEMQFISLWRITDTMKITTLHHALVNMSCHNTSLQFNSGTEGVWTDNDTTCSNRTEVVCLIWPVFLIEISLFQFDSILCKNLDQVQEVIWPHAIIGI
jgi:hypothetical protein